MNSRRRRAPPPQFAALAGPPGPAEGSSGGAIGGTSVRPISDAAASAVVGATSKTKKKKVPSLAPKETPRKKGPGGIALPEINLAYIDSNDLVRNRPPPAPPPEKANLIESKAFDRDKWMAEQMALTNAMSSMYT